MWGQADSTQRPTLEALRTLPMAFGPVIRSGVLRSWTCKTANHKRATLHPPETSLWFVLTERALVYHRPSLMFGNWQIVAERTEMMHVLLVEPATIRLHVQYNDTKLGRVFVDLVDEHQAHARRWLSAFRLVGCEASEQTPIVADAIGCTAVTTGELGSDPVSHMYTSMAVSPRRVSLPAKLDNDVAAFVEQLATTKQPLRFSTNFKQSPDSIRRAFTVAHKPPAIPLSPATPSISTGQPLFSVGLVRAFGDGLRSANVFERTVFFIDVKHVVETTAIQFSESDIVLRVVSTSKSATEDNSTAHPQDPEYAVRRVDTCKFKVSYRVNVVGLVHVHVFVKRYELLQSPFTVYVGDISLTPRSRAQMGRTLSVGDDQRAPPLLSTTMPSKTDLDEFAPQQRSSTHPTNNQTQFLSAHRPPPLFPSPPTTPNSNGALLSPLNSVEIPTSATTAATTNTMLETPARTSSQSSVGTTMAEFSQAVEFMVDLNLPRGEVLPWLYSKWVATNRLPSDLSTLTNQYILEQLNETG